jgi:hypothetical protein
MEILPSVGGLRRRRLALNEGENVRPRLGLQVAERHGGCVRESEPVDLTRWIVEIRKDGKIDGMHRPDGGEGGLSDRGDFTVPGDVCHEQRKPPGISSSSNLVVINVR